MKPATAKETIVKAIIITSVVRLVALAATAALLAAVLGTGNWH